MLCTHKKLIVVNRIPKPTEDTIIKCCHLLQRVENISRKKKRKKIVGSQIITFSWDCHAERQPHTTGHLTHVLVWA